MQLSTEDTTETKCNVKNGKNQTATISLCMIVKNEEEVLERCLRSVAEAVDEIIVVDTGSSDSTKEIAANFTEHIYDFPWKDDFAAARNFSFSKASMDYCMWLDADDIITEENRQKLLQLKTSLQARPDIVMMKYLIAFHADGKPSFSYYRERLIRNHAGFVWQGRVHESIAASANTLYSSIEIEHHKEKVQDTDRNLRIYEQMREEGIPLEPRHQFYYGRELLYHKRYGEAAAVFRAFLNQPLGWKENKIDACRQLSICYNNQHQSDKALSSLFQSFCYDIPRAEILCDIGTWYIQRNQYQSAAYWYKLALEAPVDFTNGSFYMDDYHHYFPSIQLCVCYDRLGDYKTAYFYHLKAAKYHPSTTEVVSNTAYFEKLKKEGKLDDLPDKSDYTEI